MTNHTFTHLPVPEARADAPASVVLYPVPKPESSLSKGAAFALGVVTGVVGVAVTAAIINELNAEEEG